MGDKSELLNQLKIDRTEEPASTGISGTTVAALMLLAAAGGGAGAWAVFGGADTATQPETSTTRISTATTSSSGSATAATTAPVVQKKPVVDTSNRILNASGYITARRMATVSAEIMGLITNVNVEEGMAVEQGQVLAKLDSAVATVNLNFAEAQVSVSKARLGRTEASLAEAKRVLQRTQELNSSDFSTKADLTRAQADVESFEADLLSAKADIRVAEIEAQRQRERLDDHTIRAPFAGIVTVKNAQPGEIVAPSSAGGGFTRTGICTIVDMDSLEIEVDVNEAFIGRVFEGQKVEANLDAYPDWTIPASVIAVIPTADRAKATVRVRIRIIDKDARILPDMGVKVAFLKA